MKNTITKFYKNNKFFIAYLFFFTVTTIRFFWEAHFSNFVDAENLFFHHHYWFLFVFILFLLNFKYILKLDPEKMIWTAFLSPVIFIPIIYNILFRDGGLMRLNYLSAVNFSEYIKNLFTFLLFSDLNKPVSIELLLITISIFIFGYIITKKIKRSLLCAILCYFSLMILGGTSIIAPKKPDFALIVVDSGLKLQDFFSFLYFNAAIISTTILFFKKFKTFLGNKKTLLSSTLFFFIAMATLNILADNFSLTDRIFMASHAFLISLFISSLFLKDNLQIKLFLGIQITISAKILLAAFSVQ